MAQRRYTKLTPKQEYEKYMRATDEWIKKEMIEHDAEIRADLDRMEQAKLARLKHKAQSTRAGSSRSWTPSASQLDGSQKVGLPMREM
jgi:hypothetical protein